MAVSTSISTPMPVRERVHPVPRVIVVGLRGLVNVQGGIETHARNLYPLLQRLGYQVEVVQRSPYYPRHRRPKSWHGVSLTYLWSPRRQGLETGVHTLLAILYAAIKRPDILHVHAIGPGLLVPLARLLGLRVVLTHHSIDYAREKWGPLARVLLRAGEGMGMRFANRPIAVSPVIKADVEARTGVATTFIPNGAPRPLRASTFETLTNLGLTRSRYVLCVARLEPSKRQLDLFGAFEQATMPGWKLVLVGEGQAGDPYCEYLRRCAEADDRLVLTGYRTGRALCEIYSHAGIFVLPSSSEGHPIVLLEAASYRLPILASDIAANLSVPLAQNCYFPVGDTSALARLLTDAATQTSEREADCARVCDTVRAKYSWRRAALRTQAVYDAVCFEHEPDQRGS